MSYFRVIITLGIISVFMGACNSTYHSSSTTISGTVYKAGVDSVKFFRVKDGKMASWMTLATDSLDVERRSFSLKKNVPEGFYRLKIVRQYRQFYLIPGQDVAFVLQKDTLRFKDGPSPENEIIQRWKSVYTPFIKKLFSRDLTFKKYISTVNSFLPTASAFKKTIHTPNNLFNIRMKQAVTADIETQICSTYGLHFKYPKDKVQPPDFYTKVADMRKFEHAYALALPHGFQWLKASVALHSEQYQQGVRANKFQERVSSIPNDTLKGFYIYKNIRTTGKYGADFNKMMKPLRQYLILPEYKKAVTTYEKRYANLAPGKPGINFSGVTADGTTISFDDLKGKYIYIDFWASWCQPCLYQIPYLKKIEKKYKDKNIRFLGVSLDTKDAEKAWKGKIKKHQLDGRQIRVKKAFGSKVATYYKITAIPRFMLFDPRGRIIDGNAKRPSDKRLRMQLDKLLN